MPPIQVIQRQEDPSINAIRQFGSSVSDAINQQQAVKLQIMQAKINAQNAQNEAEKLKYERKAKFLETVVKLKESGAPPEMALKFLQGTFGDDVMPGFQEMGAGMKQFLETQNPEQRLKSSQAAINEAILSGGGALGGAPSEPSGQSRLGALGGMMVSGISGGNVNLGNPAFGAAETLAKERAKTQVESERIRPFLNETLNVFQQGINEMGGLGESAIGAAVKGSLKGFESRIGKLPNVQAYNNLRPALALRVAATVNGGRPSDKDTEAVTPIAPSFTYPEPTNRILINLLGKLVSPDILDGATGDERLGNPKLRSYAAQIKKTVLDPTQSFVDAARKAGLSEQAINQQLESYYKTLGNF